MVWIVGSAAIARLGLAGAMRRRPRSSMHLLVFQSRGAIDTGAGRRDGTDGVEHGGLLPLPTSRPIGILGVPSTYSGNALYDLIRAGNGERQPTESLDLDQAELCLP
jgi:hypothetical protein